MLTSGDIIKLYENCTLYQHQLNSKIRIETDKKKIKTVEKELNMINSLVKVLQKLINFYKKSSESDDESINGSGIATKVTKKVKF